MQKIDSRRRIAVTQDLIFLYQLPNTLNLFTRKLEQSRPIILLHSLTWPRPRNRNDIRALCKHPGDRNSGGCHTMSLATAFKPSSNFIIFGKFSGKYFGKMRRDRSRPSPRKTGTGPSKSHGRSGYTKRWQCQARGMYSRG